MITFYFNGSPNPTKIALLLEEIGRPYRAIAIDPRKGEQFHPDYLKINPNAKVPSIIDEDGVSMFDSNAILLYLAEKHDAFLPEDNGQDRAAMLSWLMFVATGVGPYCGQAVHFKHFAPQGQDYPDKRYQFEARRHFEIADRHLAGRRYMVADRYTIVDMSLWAWARLIPWILREEEEAWSLFPHLKRHNDEISERPAARRAVALKDGHAFKAVMDRDARSHMFRHGQPGL